VLQGGGLDAMYAVHLRLTGKPIVDFLIVIIKLFCSLYGSGVVSQYRLEVAVVEGVGQFDPKFQVEEDVPTNYLCTVR